MKTFIKSLVIAVLFGAVSSTTLSAQTLDRAPKESASAATYEVGTYSSNDGTKLNVAVDKQAGSRVDIRLKDATGKVLFMELLGKKEEKYRAVLNISDLENGSYQLVISNGVSTVVRTVTVLTKNATESVRTVALL